jgi:2-polyprenyl-6-methoxyphenol hydroxylase-like FAD-dependent oxidoreductase
MNIPGPGMQRFSRSRLRKLCSEGVSIQYGKEFVGVSCGTNGCGITAKFSDGSTFDGDLIVGADGPRSVVRDVLLGPEKAARTYLPFWNNGTTLRFDDAEKALFVRNEFVSQMAYSPDGTFIFIAGEPRPFH